MKTLILSCNNGGGHNSVASAVQEMYYEHGQTADIIDAMSFLPQGWSKLGSDIHSYVYRNIPEVFCKGYRYAELHRKEFGRGHSARNLLALGCTKLGKYIMQQDYRRVICCHVFAGLMLTDAIRKYKLSVASGIIETDYTVTPGSEKCLLDWHFVPSGMQKEELAQLGVPEDAIAVTGIPVRAQFGTFHAKEEARKELGFDAHKKNILIACGSMGCGPIEEILGRLVARQKSGDRFTVSVLCGSNQKLREHLSQRYHAAQGIYVLGKMLDMSTVLDAADVYITKPGGISITEAAQKQLPMVLINAVGGCEKYNMDLFLGSGSAVTADDAQELADAAIRVCQDEALRQKMAEAERTIFSENDREKIYRLLEDPGSTAYTEK